MKNKNVFEQFDKNKIVVKEINKSEIFGALKSYNNPVMIKKTGKDIKEHIEKVLIPFISEKIVSLKENISSYLANAPYLPTAPTWCKINLGEEFPYKQYTWEETYYEKEKSIGNIFKGFGDVDVDCCEDCNEIISPVCCTSVEEANARTQYNIWVEDLRDAILDSRTAEVLIKNLDDKTEYYLTVDQVAALMF